MPKIIINYSPGALAKAIAALPWGAEEQPDPPIRVEFAGDQRVHATLQWALTSAKDKTDALEELGKLLSKDEAKQLVEQEDLLFQWLDKDPDNPTRFMLDPVRCLTEAKLILKGRTLERLARHRDDIRRMLPANGHEDLASLVVGMAKTQTTPPSKPRP